MLENHPGPQGYNGVTLSDRAVRQLGVEVANSQIALATMRARLEEIAETATHIDFEQWEELPVVELDESHEGQGMRPPHERRYLVPVYQVDTVMRVLTLLQQG